VPRSTAFSRALPSRNRDSREDIMSDRAVDFTGSIPAFYDHGLGPVFFTDFAEDIARRAAASAPMRVLELAAGTGIVTRRLRDLLREETRLIATDLNPPMLEVARRKFRPEESVEFQSADATALPFPDASFDAVICQFGVMFFPDKDKGHREAHRVLVSGGRYLFSVWDSHRHNPIGRLITEILAGFFPDDPPQFYQVPFGYHQLDPIKSSLHAAGFTDLRIAVLNVNKIVADVAIYARALVLGNPLVDQIRARDGVDPERVIEALAEAIPREFGTDPVCLPLQAIVVEARRR
jgi:SAM-dependent methyltransferase